MLGDAAANNMFTSHMQDKNPKIYKYIYVYIYRKFLLTFQKSHLVFQTFYN